MSPAAKIAFCHNMASGFLISARLALLAGDHAQQAEWEAKAAAYEREADVLMRAQANAA